jgi:hypothetical protein
MRIQRREISSQTDLMVRTCNPSNFNIEIFTATIVFKNMPNSTHSITATVKFGLLTQTEKSSDNPRDIYTVYKAAAVIQIMQLF